MPEDSDDTPDRDPRVPMMIRVTRAGRDAVDAEADLEDRTRSDMARILLGEAITARRRRRR